ncbi:MAG: FtsQ-type POTRA domain-containing protein [Kiritimatiellaeota bacterium]|nr:FtsQ-type POTRA domain-containing protein [Kiritimatiellota bacterium]
MKWWLFKSKSKGKEKAPAREREPAEARRKTGLETGLPPAARFALGCGAAAVVTAALGGGGKALFEQYCFKSPGLFAIPDVRRNVTVNTGTTLLPDTVREMLRLRDGMNQFSLNIGQTRRALVASEPNIKDLTIVRRLPDRMTINITERTPIARVGSATDGRVVDEDGIVFLRYAGTAGLPLIKGAEALEQVGPGERLHGMPMAAVRLVSNAQRPTVRLRLLELEMVKEDYLRLTLSDHRQATFAWEGMDDEEKDTVWKMQEHFDQLDRYMNSDLGKGLLKWDARVPGAITATVPGLQ